MFVMLVDDDSDIRDSFSQFLEEQGDRVVQAADGGDALRKLEELCQRGEELPAVVLLDHMMPTMNGSEFRERQLAHEMLRSIPVVVMTAGSDVQRLAESMCAHSALRKPMTCDALLSALRAAAASLSPCESL